MLRRSEKQDRKWMETEDASMPFFDPDAPETVATVAGELRERMLTVEQKVLAQYTASAAYATIAQQNVDTARAEARADLDRMERRLTNLVEQLRDEVVHRGDTSAARVAIPSTSLSIDAAARLGALEDRVGAMMGALEACINENLKLHRQIDDLMQRQMQAEGWVYTTGSSSELSLR